MRTATGRARWRANRVNSSPWCAVRGRIIFWVRRPTNSPARCRCLDFLKPGTKYRATIYADGPDADWKTNPTSYTISEREVSAADTLEVAMAPGGGQAVSFMPAM